MLQTRWTLAHTLHKHGQTVSALARASGLSRSTLYALVNGKTQTVTLETLDKVIAGLEQITGLPMMLSHVMQRKPTVADPNMDPDIDPELLAQFAHAKPFDWEEMQKSLPEWTDEERAEDDRYWAARENEKRLVRAALQTAYEQEMQNHTPETTP